jgi:hypothetical protein
MTFLTHETFSSTRVLINPQPLRTDTSEWSKIGFLSARRCPSSEKIALPVGMLFVVNSQYWLTVNTPFLRDAVTGIFRIEQLVAVYTVSVRHC